MAELFLIFFCIYVFAKHLFLNESKLFTFDLFPCIECCDLVFSSVPSDATLLRCHTLPWRRLTVRLQVAPTGKH